MFNPRRRQRQTTALRMLLSTSARIARSLIDSTDFIIINYEVPHFEDLSFLTLNIRLGILYSITLSLYLLLNARTMFHNHIAQLAMLLFYIRILIFKFLDRSQKYLNCIITSIFNFKSTFYFLVNRILIC